MTRIEDQYELRQRLAPMYAPGMLVKIVPHLTIRDPKVDDYIKTLRIWPTPDASMDHTDVQPGSLATVISRVYIQVPGGYAPSPWVLLLFETGELGWTYRLEGLEVQG